MLDAGWALPWAAIPANRIRASTALRVMVMELSFLERCTRFVDRFDVAGQTDIHSRDLLAAIAAVCLDRVPGLHEHGAVQGRGR